jgi:glutamate carboxypeptidase
MDAFIVANISRAAHEGKVFCAETPRFLSPFHHIDLRGNSRHSPAMQKIQSLKDYLESQLPEALEMLRQMVGINSYTANKEGVNRLAKFTAECFAPLGFTAESVPSMNPQWGDHLVLTRKGRSSKSIALISHLDTVFPPEEEARNNFRWLREGDRIFGPGTHDIKGGSVMIWQVLKALQKFSPKVFEDITWKLIWNSSEECYSPDFGDVCRRHFSPGTLAALIFESEGRGGGKNLLVVARKGRATWRVTVSGRGSHAGGKHRHGANAIVQLGRTVQSVAALTDYSRDLTVNVATICGGTVLNRVPHEAVAEGEFRTFKSEVFAHAKAGLLALTGRGDVTSPADGYPCEVKAEIVSESRPWPRNPGTDALFELFRRTSEELNVPLSCEERGGLSDGNWIWDAVPTIDGLGAYGDNDHCSERSADDSKLPEYIVVSGIVPKALVNTIAIERLAEMPGRPGK